jgi:hypothetical protein
MQVFARITERGQLLNLKHFPGCQAMFGKQSLASDFTHGCLFSLV